MQTKKMVGMIGEAPNEALARKAVNDSFQVMANLLNWINDTLSGTG